MGDWDGAVCLFYTFIPHFFSLICDINSVKNEISKYVYCCCFFCFFFLVLFLIFIFFSLTDWLFRVDNTYEKMHISFPMLKF